MKSDFESLAAPASRAGRTVGAIIHHYSAVGSTMDVAWKLAHEGATDGTVVVADHQTAGRGRFERSWVSDHGQDILCSVVLRPRVALAGELLMIAALAVTDVADSFGIDAAIKWPNDVQVAGRKIAGVIAESVTGPTAAPGNESGRDSSRDSLSEGTPERLLAVIGIGMNVNFDPSGSSHGDLAPGSTSIGAELGRKIDRLEAFTKLLGSLDSYYRTLSAGGSVMPAWRERLTTLGRTVTVVSGVEENRMVLDGLAHDVDSNGRLIVRDASGRDWPVSAGEVTVQDIR